MSALSAATGVIAPTIRYYIREGLVPPGRSTSPNQADYDDRHVRAVRLARALIDVGGLSVGRARVVLSHLADEDAETYDVLGRVQYALTSADAVPQDDARRAATERVDRLVLDHGWRVRPDNPARGVLAETIVALEALGADDVIDLLDVYADTATTVAADEVDRLLAATSSTDAVVGVVAFDVLGDRLLSALRRLAQESVVTARLRADGDH